MSSGPAVPLTSGVRSLGCCCCAAPDRALAGAACFTSLGISTRREGRKSDQTGEGDGDAESAGSGLAGSS